MTKHTATVEWTDPAVALPSLASLSGLDYLRQVASGELPPPPIASLFDFAMTTVEEGRVVFEATPTQMSFNPLGMVHGGFACTLLDTVVACAGHTTLPAGTGYTSIDLTVQYLRPIRPGIRLIATGTVIKPGRRVIFSEGRLEDAEGNLVATATSSLLVMTAG